MLLVRIPRTLRVNGRLEMGGIVSEIVRLCLWGHSPRLVSSSRAGIISKPALPTDHERTSSAIEVT
ncbi:hypothetical protein NYA9BBAC_01319 [Salinibacterium sp. NYA9b]